jgi:L-asparaginase
VIYELKTKNPETTETPSVLMIYTGGTLGMVFDRESKSLKAFDFKEILRNVPEIERLNFNLNILPFESPFDSSSVTPEIWQKIAKIIAEQYDNFDAFVILHGTDTMAYTASALSFMLDGLNKPVILTGAQLPIGVARSDARENLITALEIAADRIQGKPVLSEVAIYFNNRLLRGNRAKKSESSQFNAFDSENYPFLADVGVTVDYGFPYVKPNEENAVLNPKFGIDKDIIILKLFPGICEKMVASILEIAGLKGVILETFGAGNAPTDTWFIDLLKKAIDEGIYVYNVSQCTGGRVIQGHYETSRMLREIGVISGSDITTEAAVTKLMFLLGQELTHEEIIRKLRRPLAGEMTV